MVFSYHFKNITDQNTWHLKVFQRMIIHRPIQRSLLWELKRWDWRYFPSQVSSNKYLSCLIGSNKYMTGSNIYMTGSKRFIVNLLKPMIDFFGIPLLKNYRIVDAGLARDFFNSEEAQGHMDFAGFFSLMAQYRELRNQKGALRISGHEIGVMRDLSPNNPTDSAVMKLIRKRMQEFTGSVKHFQSNLSRNWTKVSGIDNINISRRFLCI